MAVDIVKFKSGNKSNINDTPIDAGTVYFAVDSDNTGSIYFDKNASTRVFMAGKYPTSITTSSATNQITLASGTKYSLNAGGNSYIFTMPEDVNTTYTLSSGDSNGQIKITPSSGNAYNVSVKGLGSAAFTNSTDYATAGHTHQTSISTSSGTSQITLAHGTKYAITAGGSSYVFTMPSDVNTTYTISTGDANGQIKVTPSVGSAYNVDIKGLKSAAYTNASDYATSGHTHSTSITSSNATADISLSAGGKYALNTGETSYVFTMPSAYTHPTSTAANAAAVKVGRDNLGHVVLGDALTPSDIGAATADHTHDLSIATSTGTSEISLAHGGKYVLTAGGKSYVFTMPTDNNTTYTSGTGISISDAHVISNSGVTGVKGNAESSYRTGNVNLTPANIGAATSNHTHATSIATSSAENQITLAYGTKYAITAGGTSYVFTMPSADNTDHYHSSGSWSGLTYTATNHGSAPALAFTIPTGTSSTTVARGDHNHDVSLDVSTGTSEITLARNTKYQLKVGDSIYVFTTPSSDNTNTTYTLSTGDANGQIKVTPSAGDAYNVNVKGLGSAAYTNSSAYATSGHTHTTEIKTSNATNQITLAYGTKYSISAGGTSYVFTMPASDNTDTNYYHSTGSWGSDGFTYTATANGGAPELKFTIPVGTSATTVAKGNHIHTTKIETSSSTNQLDLAFGTKYALTAGGTSYVFTTPSISNYYTKTEIDNKITNVFHYKGNKNAVSDLPTSGNITGDVWHITADGSERAWDGSAWQELGTVGANHTHTLSMATDTGSPAITLAHNQVYKLTAGGQTYLFKTPVDNNTTYTFATGDSNGQFKVTPSGGSAQNVSIKGLGSAAYTESSAYATASHDHPLSIAVDTGTSSITLAHGGKYKLTAGGKTYVFTMPAAQDLTPYARLDGANFTGAVSFGDAVTMDEATVGSLVVNGGASFTNNIQANTINGVAVGNSPKFTDSEVSTFTLSSSTGTSDIALASNTKYQLKAGSKTIIFQTPVDNNTTYVIASGDGNGQIKVTPSPGTAYNVNVTGLKSAAYTESSAYATAGHGHSVSIATSNSTNQITLSHGTKYAISVGSNSYVFTMPTGYSHPTATATNPAAVKVGKDNQGHVVLGDALTYTDVGAASSGHSHALSIATTSDNSSITLAHGTKYKLTAGGSTYVFTTPSHATYTAASAAAVKVGRDATGHVVLGAALTVNDIDGASSCIIRTWSAAPR